MDLKSLAATIAFASVILVASTAYAAPVKNNLMSKEAAPRKPTISEGQRQFELWLAANEKYERDPEHNLASKYAALRALKRSAELEYPDGLYWWANQMQWPDVLSNDSKYDAAKFKLLKRAVELGHVEAHVQLGIAYNSGAGVEKDPGKYAYHQIVAARAGIRSAISNLESSMSGPYVGFTRVVIKSPVTFHARPDYAPGGITFLRKGQVVWEVTRYKNGWTAVYIHDGYILGFVPTADFTKVGGAQ